MIYNETVEYKVKFYNDASSDSSPVLIYIDKLRNKEKAKVLKYIDFLRANKGVLDEPYSKHIKGKIRELRVDFSKNRHRIFYFTFVGKNIILLHAFLKKTPKTPESEIKKAEENYFNVINNTDLYEQN
ncbi:MAG: type II toxin-antitoxin system RelE/ParE family toxin [bacterium]